MKKIIVLAALALNLVAGTATVVTAYPQQAMAGQCGNDAC